MNRYLDDYLDARLSISDLSLIRLPRLRALARLRTWQENRRALSELSRLDARLRADIGLAPDGLHPAADARGPEACRRGGAAANDNVSALAA